MPATPAPKAVNIAMGALAVAALAAAAYVTRHGVGFDGDTMAYICAARTYAQQGKMQIIDFHGGMDVLWNWPPLYPWVLAELSRFLGDALPAAKWLDVVLFPINVLLLAAVARRLKITPGWMLFVCVLFVCAPSVLCAHVWAMSDALFLPFWLSAWLLLLQYQNRESWPVLAASALLAGLALLDRYMGFATAAAFGVYAFLGTSGNWFRKIGAATLYLALALGPLFGWFYATRHGDTLVKMRVRDVSHGTFAQSWLNPLSSILGRWVLPLDGHGLWKIAGLVLLLVIAAAWAVAFCRAGGAKEFHGWAALQRPEMSVVLSLASTQSILIVNKMFRAKDIIIEERDEIPVFVSLLLLAGVLASLSWPIFAQSGRQSWRRGLAALAGVMAAVYAMTAVIWVGQGDEKHLEWSSRQWRESPARAYIDNVPASAPIYANIVNLAYYYTGRTDLLGMPDRDVETGGVRNPQYDQQVAAMVADLAQRRGVLVMVNVDTAGGTVEVLRHSAIDDFRKMPTLRVVLDTPQVTIFTAAVK